MIVFLNRGAKSGDERRARVEAALSQHGVACPVVEVDDGEELTALARQARAEGHLTIVAGGGDGTLNAVAGALLDSEVAFGVLPLGTYNHFAKDLQIPLTLDGAIEVLLRGNVRAIDVGEVNGQPFLNNSAIGLYPHLVELRERQRRLLGAGKRAAMTRAVLRTFRNLPSLAVHVDAEHAAISAKTRSVFVGNNVYALTGGELGTRSRLDEGRLCVYVTPHLSRGRLVAMAFQALLGRMPRDDELRLLHADELWIRTWERHVRVSLDGEVRRLSAPLHYRIRPRALRVVVP